MENCSSGPGDFLKTRFVPMPSIVPWQGIFLNRTTDGASHDLMTHEAQVEAAVFPGTRASWTTTGLRPDAGWKPAYPGRRQTRDAHAPGASSR